MTAEASLPSPRRGPLRLRLILAVLARPELRRTNPTLRETSGVSRATSISLGGNVDKKEECNGHKRPLCLHGAKSMSGFSDPGQLPALCSPLALGQSSNKPRGVCTWASFSYMCLLAFLLLLAPSPRILATTVSDPGCLSYTAI